MNMISMDKKYRRRGGTKPVRVLCVDAIGRKPVVFLDEKHSVVQATISGFFYPLDTQNESDNDLVEYIEPKMVPLGPEDLLPSFRFRINGRSSSWFSATSCKNETIYFGSSKLSVSYVNLSLYYEVDRNDGKGWVACEKQAGE